MWRNHHKTNLSSVFKGPHVIEQSWENGLQCFKRSQVAETVAEAGFVVAVTAASETIGSAFAAWVWNTVWKLVVQEHVQLGQLIHFLLHHVLGLHNCRNQLWVVLGLLHHFVEHVVSGGLTHISSEGYTRHRRCAKPIVIRIFGSLLLDMYAELIWLRNVQFFLNFSSC
jgi:hypothetical protein